MCVDDSDQKPTDFVRRAKKMLSLLLVYYQDIEIKGLSGESTLLSACWWVVQ